MKTLFLVRHGAPDEGNLERPHDPPLNATGLRQASELAARLTDARIDRIVSSPQLRARNTAAPLAERLGLPIHILDGLAEIDLYADRYVSPETVRRQTPERWREFLQSPARFFGRDEEEFRSGVLNAVAAILADPRGTAVALFTHGTPIRTIVLHVVSAANAKQFPISHCSITRVSGGSIDALRLESVAEPLASQAAR
jgi:broad specificity phosphatase PhoE